jgi:transcriptional regulator with XRE-family HTH domain
MTEQTTKATGWRKRHKLSLDQLAIMTGYSKVTLYWYFRGLTPPRTAKHIAGKQKSKPIGDPEWLRFRNICAGVEYQIKNSKGFNW